MITKNIIDNDLLEELAIITIELPLLHITLDLVTTTITEILAHIVHRIELLTDHLIDVIHVPVTNLDHTQEITTFHDTLLDRPPSRPRDSRYSRSRCHSQTRNKINNIQPQASTDPINFEIHMYHPTEMANALNPTSWFYSLYTHTSSNQNHRDYSSRLEISFLLDSGASISLLNHPTFITIAKLLNIKQNPPHNSSKTLTVANQTEVPILDYSTITLNTTIEDNSRQFTIPFAVADIKYNILGTPFFEENIQNINIQDFTLQFKHHSRVYPNYGKFTSLLSKDYPDFSYIYRINSKTQIRLKPNSSKIAHSPNNNYYNLHFSTTPQKQFFPTIQRSRKT